MEGFRFLKIGERVSYELEVGEKGMKAVGVDLLEPRPPQEPRDSYRSRDRDDGYRSRDRDDYRPRNGGGNDRAVEQMRRKQERLISLLVEKGILSPGEIDGIAGGNDAYDDDGDDGDGDDYDDRDRD